MKFPRIASSSLLVTLLPAATVLQKRAVVAAKTTRKRTSSSQLRRPSSRRGLMEGMSNATGHGDMTFGPLMCNEMPVDVSMPDCLVNPSTSLTLSSLVDAASPGSPVVIPCGKCATVDYSNDGSSPASIIDLPDGLDVLGRLHFPPSSHVEIRTTHVFVQGVLDMAKPDDGNGVKFYLYGTQDEFVYSAEHCGGEGTGTVLDQTTCEHKKKVGKKAFAVMGGQVIIEAAPDCPSWTKLRSVDLEPIVPPPSGCPTDYGVLSVPDGTFQSSSSLDGVNQLWPHVRDDDGVLHSASLSLATDTTDGNVFLRQTDRPQTQTGLVFAISGHCVLPDQRYKLTFRYRIGSAGPPSWQVAAMVSTKINAGGSTWQPHENLVDVKCDGGAAGDPGDDGRTSAPNVWTQCEAMLLGLTEEQAGHGEVLLRFHLGYDAGVDVDYDDVSLVAYKIPTYTKTLNVDPAFAACVRPGEELLLTSYEIGGWDRETVRTVTTVDPVAGTIVIDEVVNGMIPTEVVPAGHEEEAAFAVEVARLNRDVVFEAEQEEVDPNDPEVLHGGHFIVLHTPGVSQIISGVEIKGFGQHGILGRYPIHFHMSGQVGHATMVYRNVVRRSNQRCVVVHGTHGVLVEDNVSYDAFGHCYILEDSVETDNAFRYNLGAKTKTHRVDLSNEETIASDHGPEVSTFWCTNPDNHWVGNVAAGSEKMGFWFDTNLTANGPSRSLPQYEGVKPVLVPLGTFEDNVAHSNGENGVQLYPRGWHPSELSTLTGTHSYKNLNTGILVHGNKNVVVTSSLMADNKQCAKHFFNAGANPLTNSVCIVKSEDVRNRDGDVCGPDGWYTLVTGIMAAYNEFEGGAMDLTDVEIKGYRDVYCASKPVLALSYHGFFNHGLFESGASQMVVPRMTGLTFESPSNKFDIPCDLVASGSATNVYLEDSDGSLAPEGRPANPGFYVQNAPVMTAFLPSASCGAANPHRTDSCALWCDNVCLRQLRVDPGPDVHAVVVTETGVGLSHSYGRNLDGLFDAVLPLGEYALSFKDSAGADVKPSNPLVTLGDPPLCPDHITESSIAGIEKDCPANGDVVRGDGSAQSRFTYGFGPSHWGGGDVSIVVTEGVAGEYHFDQDGLLGTTGGMAVQIDLGCAVAGETYSFKARYKSDAAGGDVLWAQLRTYHPNDSLKSASWVQCPSTSSSSGDPVGCEQTFVLTQDMADAARMDVYLSWRNKATSRAYYDDISIKPVQQFVSDGSILKGDGSASSGSLYGFFQSWGGGPIAITNDGNGNSYFAQAASASAPGGMGVELDPALAESGVTYSFRAKYRSSSTADNILWAQLRNYHPNGSVKLASWIKCPDPARDGLGWVTCDENVVLTSDMVDTAKLELFLSWRSGITADNDYDDISFSPVVTA